MSENWEFALSQVKDGYVMYLGDDDGLLPNAIENINRIINEYNYPAISWNCETYYWPNSTKEKERNILTLNFENKVEIRSGREMLKDVLNFERPWRDLPFLYMYGFVDHQVILKAKNGLDRFFNSCIPDIYSGIVLGFHCDRFVFSREPFSIGGTSAHSTGASNSNLSTENSKVKGPSTTFYNENKIEIHPLVPSVITPQLIVAETYFQFNDRYPNSGMKFSVEKLISKCLSSYQYSEKDSYESVKSELNQLARIHNLQDYFSSMLTRYPNKVSKVKNSNVFGFYITGTGAILDGAKYGVKNIYDATQLSYFARTITRNKELSFPKKLIHAIRTIRKRILKTLVHAQK